MSTDALLTIDPATLPDDAALLKRVIVQHRQQLVEHRVLVERIKQEASEQLAAQRAQLEAQHKAEMAAVLRRFYGPKNERFDPRQLLLFGLQVEQAAGQLDNPAEFDAEAQPPARRKKQGKRHEHGRGKLPDHLPRIPIEHDLTDDEKKCPCCGELRCRTGAPEVSEQLEMLPPKFTVLQHIRHKYACSHCEQQALNPQFQVAAKPPQPIDRCLAAPGLLAYVAVSKWCDHLPLYRLENIFKRAQVHIPRSTMCGWLAGLGELIRPLVERMTTRIRLSRKIHTDDTRVPVQAKGKCKSGRLWVYLGDLANPYVVYDYTPDRTRAGPANWLRDFRGYLQADAYGGYDGIYAGGNVQEVACWAHARRKFIAAQTTDLKRSVQMLEFARQLYAVEGQGKELDDDARRALRQAQSVPILQQIKAWLDEEGQVVLPRSPIGEAFTYTLNQWDALCRYTSEGFLNIDNNAAERGVKPIAIGRKNWLFAGDDNAGGTAARLYSLIASAQRHDLDPQRYLTSVLAQMPCTPEAEWDRFLPDVWKRADEAERAGVGAATAST